MYFIFFLVRCVQDSALTQKEKEGSQLHLELKEQLTAVRAELTESRGHNETLRETIDKVGG